MIYSRKLNVKYNLGTQQEDKKMKKIGRKPRDKFLRYLRS